MSSRCRYISGDTNSIVVLADPSYPVEKGDLIYIHPATGAGRPASALNNEGSVAANQLGFAEYFVGVCEQSNGLQSGTGAYQNETTFRQDGAYQKTFRVATSGRFEFDCPAQVFTQPIAMGVYATASGCSNQKVDALASPAPLSAAIGIARPSVAALESGASMDRVQVEIMGKKAPGTTPVAGTYSGTSGQ